jgi:hypothetical protein
MSKKEQRKREVIGISCLLGASCLLVFIFVYVTMINASSQDNGEARVSFTVLKEDIFDGPGKTQIKQILLVEPDISRADLRALLNSRFKEANRRRGFKYHTHPTVIAIYTYSSREHADSGMGQWIGMIIKVPPDALPEIRIHPSVGRALDSQVLFGLTETQRKSIFKRIVSAEDQADDEAFRQYPTDVKKAAERMNELTEANKKALARGAGLSLSQLKEIAIEGLKKNWPMP